MAFDGLERLVRNLLIDNVNFRNGHYFAENPTSSGFVRHVLKDQAEAILERLAEVRSLSVDMATEDEMNDEARAIPIEIDRFLLDLAEERQSDKGSWTGTDCFDPPHGRTEISYAKARGWIEAAQRSDGGIRMRLTAKGIEALETWPVPAPNVPASTLVEKARELVRDLAPDENYPEEKWFCRTDLDPVYSAVEIDAAHSDGWIEVTHREDEDNMQFRFTRMGLDRLDALRVVGPDSPSPAPSI